MPEFGGLKLSQDENAARYFDDVHHTPLACGHRRGSGADLMHFDRPGHIGWGGNSGFQALNLAAQMGPARIVLVGLDMTITGGVHWHGAHPDNSYKLHNPTEQITNRWARPIEAAAPVLAERGIEVLNASAVSKLTAYAKVNFEDLF